MKSYEKSQFVQIETFLSDLSQHDPSLTLRLV